MSNDQKPARMKIVSGSAPARAPRDIAKAVVAEPEAAAEPVDRAMRAGVIVFLLGCLLGGAALAAWPHVVAG